MRNRNTLEFLGIWEQIHNPDFKGGEFDTFNKKSNPEPGVKTMWIGLRNLQEHLKAKEAFESVHGLTCGE